MTVSDWAELAGVALLALTSIGTVVYWAVRLAIRAEVQAVELRISDKYVLKETCHAIRRDCAALRAATGGQHQCDSTT